MRMVSQRAVNTLVNRAKALLPADLLAAATKGDLALVQLCVKMKVDLECTDSDFGQTPLIIACDKGRSGVAAWLIDAGANVNAKDTCEEMTPLIAATCCGLADIVCLLLLNGADRDIQDEAGNTALNYARDRGYDAVHSLLEKSVDELNAWANSMHTVQHM